MAAPPVPCIPAGIRLAASGVMKLRVSRPASVRTILTVRPSTLLALVLLGFLATPGQAAGPRTGPTAGTVPEPAAGPAAAGPTACADAAASEERRLGIPRHLLHAIALAESGRWIANRKATVAWPWTVTSGDQSWYFNTADAAVSHVRALKKQGVRNIDVGCVQINLYHHPDAFPSLEQAFDPATNIRYGAEFLADLKRETRSWTKAAGFYHSRTPGREAAYRAKVVRHWRNAQGVATPASRAGAAAAVPPRSSGDTIAARRARAKAWRNARDAGLRAAAEAREATRQAAREARRQARQDRLALATPDRSAPPDTSSGAPNG